MSFSCNEVTSEISFKEDIKDNNIGDPTNPTFIAYPRVGHQRYSPGEPFHTPVIGLICFIFMLYLWDIYNPKIYNKCLIGWDLTTESRSQAINVIHFNTPLKGYSYLIYC